MYLSFQCKVAAGGFLVKHVSWGGKQRRLLAHGAQGSAYGKERANEFGAFVVVAVPTRPQPQIPSENVAQLTLSLKTFAGRGFTAATTMKVNF